MEFFDIDKQYLQIRKKFLKKMDLIMRNGDFILGKEVESFEKEFANYCKTKYAVGLNSGADALFLSLKSLGIGPGDEVIVPTFTFIATSFAVSHTGANPVFVDIDDATYNINPENIEKAINRRTKAIIPVHLFGLCANMPEILKIAKRHNLYVIEDAAQAHGAKFKGRIAGSIGNFGCFSFYPTKNLSAFGDAGMITTNSKKLYKRLLQLRDCGRSNKRYLHPIIGYNSRLDNAQAAFLRYKLGMIEKWNTTRIDNANIYSQYLEGIKGVIVPKIPKHLRHVFHIYPIRTKRRKKLISGFKKDRIPFSIFYPLPLHLQKANRYLGYKQGDFPIAEKVSKQILALPVHPHMKKKDILKIVSVIRKVHNG